MKALVFVTATYAIFRMWNTGPASPHQEDVAAHKWSAWIASLLIFGGCVAGIVD